MAIVLLLPVLWVLLPVTALAQEPFPGWTLISPLDTNESFFVDIDLTTTSPLHGADAPAQVAYRLPDNSLLRPCRDPNGAFQAGGAGGRIQRISSSDHVVWDYFFSTSEHQQHHDVEPMPSGNVLVIAWELKTRQEALAAGRQTIAGDMWPTMIAELHPVGATGANVVWEWHLWDHLIQEVDPAKDNYGVIADHPELVDINISGAQNGTWDHADAIDYNAEFDQIVISCRKMHEFYVIDHSTTTEEAAGHTGGDRGQGGDILYRWGNPQNYDRGTPADQYYYAVHSAQWIDPGLPGGGHFLTFNNGFRGAPNNYSSVEEIVPPVDANGNYFLEPGEAYGPAAPVWSYENPASFYSQAQGGVQRLPNGDTLITESDDGLVFEVTVDGAVVWVYFAPAAVHRALRYWTRPIAVRPTPGPMATLERNFPNPFNPQTTIVFELARPGRVRLDVFDLSGRLVDTLVDADLPAGRHDTIWRGRDRWDRPVSSGTYVCRLTSPDFVQSRKMVLTK
jgi:hypothetical protein